MATTQNNYTGNGSNKLFSITFPYLDTADIDVFLNGTLQTVTTQYTFANATTIEFVAAPANGAAVRIDRSTDDSALAATFFPGSSIKAADLNADFDQTLYVVQEINNKAVKLDDPLYVNKTYIDNADALKVTKAGDSMSGVLAMGTNKITGLGNPTNAQDAATKTYVDAADALKVAKAGDSMTGPLAMGTNKVTGMGNPTDAQDATTKTYVDTADALKVAKAGDTMSGNLAMGGNKVTGLGTPTANADAVTKSYLDAYINTAYLGPLASDPAVRPSGGALQAGDIYFNTTQNILKAYTGSIWVISAAAGNIVRWRKTASAGNTTLSGVDDLGVTLSYVVGNEQVYLNGALQTRGVDYTAATGTSITLTPALLAGDVVELHAVQGYVSATITPGSINDALVAPAAGIQYSKLALSNSIVNADVNASAGIVATKLAFTQAGTGAVARTVDSKLKETVSVKDFGAVGDGVTDDTAAFNLATRATVAHGGNGDLAMRRNIFVPPGDYNIAGTVYLRKGQILSGAGDGSSRILSPVTSTGRVTIKMGFGLISGVVTQDAGGLPPVVENLATEGGDTSGAVFDSQVPGAILRNLFITSPGVGIQLGSGDVLVSDCIIDQGLNGMNITGQNIIISNVLFYNINYSMNVQNNTYDLQVNNCHFEYGIYNDILFTDAASNIQNVSITGCQFVKNTQYATADPDINIRANSTTINIRSCDFRNTFGYSIARTNGIGSVVKISDCTFDGNKTNPAYAQSTTAAGIIATNGNFEITDCTFRNLFGNPVTIAHTGAYNTIVSNCSYRNIATATSFVTMSGSQGSLVIVNCIGDNVLKLFNTQSSITVSAKNNKNWLGAVQTASSRYYWVIPTQGSSIANVGIKANTNPGGNANYRKSTNALVARSTDFNGSVVTDYTAKTDLYAAPGIFASAIDLQLALDSVGGGANGAYSTLGRNLVISVPNTYTAVELEVDYVV
jgi:hypothetical protein